MQRHLCPHHLECYQRIELSAGNAVRNAIWCSSFHWFTRFCHARKGLISLACGLQRGGTAAVTYLSASDTGPHPLCCVVLLLSYIWTDQSWGFFIFLFFWYRSRAKSGRPARQRAARMLSLLGTKRKWQGNRHSVSIAMVAQARLFIPRLMGWQSARLGEKCVCFT